jgi:hypothetical protein
MIVRYIRHHGEHVLSWEGEQTPFVMPRRITAAALAIVADIVAIIVEIPIAIAIAIAIAAKGTACAAGAGSAKVTCAASAAATATTVTTAATANGTAGLERFVLSLTLLLLFLEILDQADWRSTRSFFY